MICKHCGVPIKFHDNEWVHIPTRLAFCTLRDFTIAEPKAA